MKLIHLGDLHLGKTLGEFHLLEDQKFILDQILQTARERAVDAVLIAGDVYDKAVPSEGAVAVFDSFLSELAKLRVRTFVISGNHDSEERLNFGSRLFASNGLYISAKYNGTLYRQECEDEHGKVNVYLLPFVKASQVKRFFPEEKIDSYDKAVRAALARADIDQTERNILVAHQFVAGKGEEPQPGGSESAAVLNVGLVEKVGADCFQAFDYVALGHIHSPQRVGREEIRYCGSPLKYSLSEARNEKSFPFVTLGEKGEVLVELVKLSPRRDVRHIKGKLEQLLDEKTITDPDDFIYATLTEEDPIDDAMGIFRQYYPNTVRIDYDNAHSRAMGQVDFSRITEDRSFSELFSEFYQYVYGCEMDAEELCVMNEIAREAGVADETD